MMATQDTDGQLLRVWRAATFEELGFDAEQSLALADSAGLDGFKLSHHDVRRYLADGCSKDLVIKIFT